MVDIDRYVGMYDIDEYLDFLLLIASTYCQICQFSRKISITGILL